MKYSALFLICTLTISSLFVAGCENTMIDPSGTASKSISIDALPQDAINFISTYYDMNHLSAARHHIHSSGDDIFEANLNWGTDLYFDGRGSFKGSRDDDNGNDDYLSISDLPNSILTYISDHFSISIVEAERNHHANGSYSFEIELSDGVEIYFDQSGNFIALDDKGGRGNGQSSHIGGSDLPAAILAYIQTNFPGASIIKAEKKLNPDGSFRKYEVELSTGQELDFDATGNFLADDSSSSGSGEDSIDIAVSALPQTVRDYLDTNFSGQQIERAKKRLNDNGSVRNYEVRLSDKTKVFFSADGSFMGTDR